MNTDVPYMISVGNLHKILDAIQRAAAPQVFNIEFLKDLGFTSSQDRPTPKLFKFLGFLDDSGRPAAAYRDFMDHTRAKQVLAARMRVAFDDLFTADRTANLKTAEQLKGWFKTKTGVGDAVAKKIATTFKTLATYADFTSQQIDSSGETSAFVDETPPNGERASGAAAALAAAAAAAAAAASANLKPTHGAQAGAIGLVYRLEIHLPDTQNVDTFRAIFRALREELT